MISAIALHMLPCVLLPHAAQRGSIGLPGRAVPLLLQVRLLPKAAAVS